MLYKDIRNSERSGSQNSSPSKIVNGAVNLLESWSTKLKKGNPQNSGSGFQITYTQRYLRFHILACILQRLSSLLNHCYSSINSFIWNSIVCCPCFIKNKLLFCKLIFAICGIVEQTSLLMLQRDMLVYAYEMTIFDTYNTLKSYKI